jgi:hypothetical protein
MGQALKPVLLEKVKAEDRLKALAAEKGMPFVIVRPGGALRVESS